MMRMTGRGQAVVVVWCDNGGGGSDDMWDHWVVNGCSAGNYNSVAALVFCTILADAEGWMRASTRNNILLPKHVEDVSS